jgi:glutamate-1-semialdehyde 2,1-aminomutase
VVHAGTLNGNGIAMAATKASLEVLKRKGNNGYEELQKLGYRLRLELEKILREKGHQVVTSGCGSVFQLSFMGKVARNYRETMRADKGRYSDFALALLDEGILVLPDGRWYISFSHSDEDIDATLEATRRAVT